jgi:hypothetical protein
MLKEIDSPRRRRLFRLPSPAMVIALIALLIATAGTAYGVKSVRHYPEFNGVDIIDNSLTSADIKNGSLGRVDMSSSALRSLRGLRGAQGPAGPQGPQGPAGINGAAGAQGAPGPVKVVYRASGSISQDPFSQDSGVAQCDAGLYAVGGGVVTSGDYDQQQVNSSWPVPTNSSSNVSTAWGAYVDNISNVAQSFKVYVICVQPSAVVGKTSGASLSKAELH